MGGSDREAGFSLILTPFRRSFLGEALLRQSLDGSSVESGAEETPPGLGQTELESELKDHILEPNSSLHDLKPTASPP